MWRREQSRRTSCVIGSQGCLCGRAGQRLLLVHLESTDLSSTRPTLEQWHENLLHQYTITHAIEDGNVLRFHVDYYKPKEGETGPDKALLKQAVVNAILDKHDAASGDRRFNAILATASINDAIHYYDLFQSIQLGRTVTHPDFVPLNIAVVFSPPGDVSPDVKQIQEDLPQEQEDNKIDPEGKKKALTRIIADYNARYGTNHSINEFDQYYQDVQKRIKDQQFPNHDLPGKGAEMIDITIVVDMLLTGFDSKYLNTLYVDKNLKHHGLIQAFSRTNRVLNASKPYGHILDFRGQQNAVDEAIKMFSGVEGNVEQARQIWLVERAPVVIDKLKDAKTALDSFLKSQGLNPKAEEVGKLKGNGAKAAFVELFKSVQKLQTQLDQYTDLTPEQAKTIEQVLPKDDLRAFRGQYLEVAQKLKELREKPGEKQKDPKVDQLDFEFVLFASATIDYDYIMKLAAEYTATGGGGKGGKAKMTREQLAGLIASDSKFIDDRETLTAYVMTLKAGEGLDERAIREGYQAFKAERAAREVAELAARHGLAEAPLQGFVDRVLTPPFVFDAEGLTALFDPLVEGGLGWRERAQKELALMADHPQTLHLPKRPRRRGGSGRSRPSPGPRECNSSGASVHSTRPCRGRRPRPDAPPAYSSAGRSPGRSPAPSAGRSTGTAGGAPAGPDP